MSPIAALVLFITGVATITIIAALLVHRHDPQHVRRRDLKAATEEAKALRAALQKIEDQAVNNPDGFILNTDVLKITRSL